jgi:hypothetical protein
MKKYRHQHESIFDHFQLFLGDLLGRNGLALCGIRMHSKLDHYDLWSRPGGPPMFTFRFHYFASSQLLVRASYLDRTLVALAVLVIFIVLVVIVVLVVPQTCFSVRGSGGVDRRGGGVSRIRRGSLRCSGACSVLFVYHKRVPLTHQITTLDPPQSITVLRCMRGAHFYHKCAPLPHRNVPHSRTKLLLWIRRRALRCSGAWVVQIFSFLGCPWRPLAAPGCPWLSLAAPGLLLAAPGCCWAAPGCSWLLLAAPGCSWLPLAAPGCLWLLLDASGCY